MPDDDWSDEETDNPLYADDRNFYKVENGRLTARKSIVCSTPATISARLGRYSIATLRNLREHGWH